MSLEDPRIRLRQRQQQQPIDSASIISNNLEQIPMQVRANMIRCAYQAGGRNSLQP